MPLSDNDVHMILLGVSAITLVLVSLTLIAVMHKAENYSEYGSIKDQTNHYENKNIIKRYTFGVQDPSRQQIVLNATLHPDAILRQQIDDNYGQLERLKVLMEEQLFEVDPTKEYHIKEIELRPTVDGTNFVVSGKTYPSYTYALLHLKREDNGQQALIPLTDVMGGGAEELIYSKITDAIQNPDSPIRAIL